MLFKTTYLALLCKNQAAGARIMHTIYSTHIKFRKEVFSYQGTGMSFAHSLSNNHNFLKIEKILEIN